MIAAALLACAANVAPVTLEAVIRVESGGNPIALNVNRLEGPQPRLATATEAAETARRYIERGYSVDIGLTQINSANLARLGLTVEQALDPCTNVAGGARILTADYAEAARSRGDGQPALQAALSAYNTGDFYRGFGNGYVARYYERGAVPALAKEISAATALAAASRRAAPLRPPNPYTADTTVAFTEMQNVQFGE